MEAYHCTKLITLDWFTRFALKNAIDNVILRLVMDSRFRNPEGSCSASNLGHQRDKHSMIGLNGLFIGGFSSDILKEVIVADYEYLIREREHGGQLRREVWCA